jgi:amino acid adenylation domain-containing protein
MTSYPLTPSQNHLLKSQLITPGKPLFNQVVTATLSGQTFMDADVEALCEAWQSVQLRHPVLGATIIGSGSTGFVQQPGQARPEMEVIDLESGPGKFAHRFKTWISQRMQQTFELDKSLTDAAVVRHGQDELIVYLNMHHLIADAWSSNLVLEDLIQSFNTASNRAKPTDQERSSPPAPEPKVTFFDYALAFSGPQTQNLQFESPHKTPGHVPGTALPSFYGHINDHFTTDSVRKPVDLSGDEHARLQGLSKVKELQQFSESLFQLSFHLTALSIFLHKASGDTELVIEIPLLGRFSKQWMNVAGNFIEMIRVSVRINPDDTVLAVFKRNRDILFEALRGAKPGCTAMLEPSPVHGVLNLITARQSSPAAAGATFEWHHPGHSDMSHPVRLHVADWNATGTPGIEVDLNQAFFALPFIDRAPRHLANTYRAILESRETPVSCLSIVTQDEKWSFRGAQIPGDTDSKAALPARLADVAVSMPDAIALTDGETSVSYRELSENAEKVESHLRNHDIGSGQRVAVHMSRSLQLPIVILGILRTGASYVPIDPDQPKLRVEEILGDAGVACLVTDTDASLAPGLLTLSANTMLDSNPQHLQQAPVDGLSGSVDIDPASPAYLLYTSGSTGKPKGVVVSHGSLMSYLDWASSYYATASPMVMPLFTSIGFDLTVTSLFMPWLSGGTLRVFPQTADHQALLLLDVIRDKSINTIKLTPAHLKVLINAQAESPGIRQLIVGGEDLKTETARQTADLFDQDVRIINEYGPTEATVGCIVRAWSGDPAQGSVPIGLPIDGMSAHVLDDSLQPQLEGVAGELFLSGPSLAQGYWNNPEATEQAFIDNPWIPGERLYRTGDCVRVMDGEMVYLGRADGQVKINGHRVELGEIEAALLSHPDIDECVVMAQAGTAQGKQEEEETFCKECGLSSKYPDARFDTDGVCNLCNDFKRNKNRVDGYFRNMDDLSALITTIKQQRRGDYDALVLVSGGKDSTYTLCKLVDLGLKVYALTLDNGFISDQAKQNIDYVCGALGVDHHHATTPHMNAIFADSLERHSNVCDGCFKTIYNLSLKFAADHDIDYIFTGLSRGQLFETRFNIELFSEFALPPEKIDDMVQAARIQYHSVEDAANTLLCIKNVNDGTLASQISIIDFFRYCQVELSDMLEYLKSRIGWVRPTDTGRSTNCLLNDTGIFVHKLEKGFHNYSLPYSWDVRLGHKKRQDVLDELNDDIDPDDVDKHLKEIGYLPKTDEAGGSVLHAYFTGASQLDRLALTDWLGERLPEYMLPRRFDHLNSMPLNAHGKVDRHALESLKSRRPDTESSEPPQTPTEELVADLWKQYTGVELIYQLDNFFQLGGDSLSAIRCAMDLRRMGYETEPADLFRVPELARFAHLLDQAPKRQGSTPTDRPERFASLDQSQQERLKSLLARQPTSEN